MQINSLAGTVMFSMPGGVSGSWCCCWFWWWLWGWSGLCPAPVWYGDVGWTLATGVSGPARPDAEKPAAVRDAAAAVAAAPFASRRCWMTAYAWRWNEGGFVNSFFSLFLNMFLHPSYT